MEYNGLIMMYHSYHITIVIGLSCRLSFRLGNVSFCMLKLQYYRKEGGKKQQQ
jgi:hypothetical protein